MPPYFEPWFAYQHPIVRQLAFAIASPNIIRSIPNELDLKYDFQLHPDHFWQDQFGHYQTRLLELDQNPQVLLDFLARLKSTRLGLRFEHLIWFWLCDEKYHHYRLLGHSIQIIAGKNTLGELDFLLFNKQSQKIEHWEVALKFYLAEADLSLKHWYGLNRSDTLSRKLHHFSHQQFQFESALEHRIEQRFTILKGQLYLPRHPDLTPKIQPDWMNNSRRLGTWGHQIQAEFYCLQRQEWICPHVIESSSPARWWTNGLYFQAKTRLHYMYRQPPISYLSV
ncbi:DUF1853 family protein [Acinetobacter sp. ANC 4648]|uniref:DUF1853 family protein n=1 Tax=Acinetobacter sp. ANC 4648 TaxID=1977875 RepID=UPI000A3358DD|nr:DUF1853 family protein [Acinetobacter sp. ANC 4648]OTG83820.1 hypothetical protein B9T27_04810 [Acinetobacter sp. ANC 4648]